MAKAKTKKKAGPVSRKGLTQKQENFALSYFKSGNASGAYRVAYAPPKMSAKQINTEASKLLKHPDIARRIEVLRERQAARTVLDVDRLDQELARLCFSRMEDYYDAKGNLRPIHELDEHAQAALAGVETLEEYEGRGNSRRLIGFTRKVKLWDKKSALEIAYRRKGAFKEDNKQKTDPVTALLAWVSANNAATGTHGLPIKT